MSEESVLGNIADGFLGAIDEMKAENVALKAEVEKLKSTEIIQSTNPCDYCSYQEGCLQENCEMKLVRVQLFKGRKLRPC